MRGGLALVVFGVLLLIPVPPLGALLIVLGLLLLALRSYFKI
jgi:hypothetical protein